MPRGDGGRTPLDDLDHLSRSPHRARVIRLLASGDWTRRDLHDETGIPQPTLGRILGSFQDRGWLTRAGEAYTLTLRGELVAGQFLSALEALETVQRLPPDGNFEPLLERGFDPEWLASVDVAETGDDLDWYGHLREVRRSVAAVDAVRELAPGPLPGVPDLLVDQLRDGGTTVESVFSRASFESFVADPENRSAVVALLRTGNARIHLVEEPISFYAGRHGDRAVFDVPSAAGGPVVRFTSDRQAVVEWVDDTIDDFRDRGETLSVADLSE
jgi:predicted transcriptional regulator